MNRFIYILLFSMLLSSCKPDKKQEKEQEQPPNIIFIMTDDHAYQALSAYDDRLISTPNLDELAEEGMRFNQSFVTNSISAPSRATLLTGQYSHKNGVIDNMKSFDTTLVTFPRLLQDAGYQTAMIGKWHLKTEPQGFDYWKVLPGQGSYYNPDFIEMGENVKDTGYVTDLITNDVIDWINQANENQDKPFAVVYNHKAPHREWWPGPDHLNTFDDKKFPLPHTLFDQYKGRKAAEQALMAIDSNMYLSSDLKVKPEYVKGKGLYPDEEHVRRYNLYTRKYNRMTDAQKEAWDKAYQDRQEEFLQKDMTGKDLVEWKYQQYMEDYLRCIASVDDNIGRLMDYLEKKGLEENTIVVYTSDQGFYLGEHGWFDKRFMYEQSLRMPLIVRYPEKVKAGSVNDDIVLNLDFAPTLLDYAGVEIPEQMQGRSMKPVLEGNTPEDWRDAMYYHYYEYPAWHGVKRHYGVRTDRYKLMHFYYDIDQWEFYDLKKDSLEMHNEIDNPEYQDEIERLKKIIEEKRKEFGDSDSLQQEYIERWIDKGRTENYF